MNDIEKRRSKLLHFGTEHVTDEDLEKRLKEFRRKIESLHTIYIPEGFKPEAHPRLTNEI